MYGEFPNTPQPKIIHLLQDLQEEEEKPKQKKNEEFSMLINHVCTCTDITAMTIHILRQYNTFFSH